MTQSDINQIQRGSIHLVMVLYRTFGGDLKGTSTEHWLRYWLSGASSTLLALSPCFPPVAAPASASTPPQPQPLVRASR